MMFSSAHFPAQKKSPTRNHGAARRTLSREESCVTRLAQGPDFRRSVYVCGAILGSRAAKSFASLLRAAAMFEQRLPITVAGPWPIFTAFLLALRSVNWTLRKGYPASRLNFTNASLCATPLRVKSLMDTAACRPQLSASRFLSDFSIWASAFRRWRASLHWNPRAKKARSKRRPWIGARLRAAKAPWSPRSLFWPW
jgi:hypothetical protein